MHSWAPIPTNSQHDWTSHQCCWRLPLPALHSRLGVARPHGQPSQRRVVGVVGARPLLPQPAPEGQSRPTVLPHHPTSPPLPACRAHASAQLLLSFARPFTPLFFFFFSFGKSQSLPARSTAITTVLLNLFAKALSVIRMCTPKKPRFPSSKTKHELCIHALPWGVKADHREHQPFCLCNRSILDSKNWKQ